VTPPAPDDLSRPDRHLSGKFARAATAIDATGDKSRDKTGDKTDDRTIYEGMTVGSPEAAVAELLELLDLREVDAHVFEGAHSPISRSRVFGGQLLAQGLRAAALTTPSGRLPHSLHAYFVRAAHPGSPLRFEVDPIRDGASISARRVGVWQDGHELCTMTTSFAVPDTGSPQMVLRHAGSSPPGPEGLLTAPQRLAPYADEHDGWWVRRRPFELRPGDQTPREALDSTDPGPGDAGRWAWLRADGPVPDDPTVNACMLAYASDMTLLEPLLVRRKSTPLGPGSVASLDHAMWFHQTPAVGEWTLYEKRVVGESATRGLCLGHFYTASGVLVATAIQEGYVRKPRG
jgi:acyl-CoA thioesterase-2